MSTPINLSRLAKVMESWVCQGIDLELPKNKFVLNYPVPTETKKYKRLS